MPSAATPEDRGGDAGAVGDLVEGDLGLLDVKGDAADQRALEHPGGSLLVTSTHVPGCHRGVPNVDADAVPSSVLHAPQLEDPRAGGGELEHLLVGDAVDLRASGWVRGRR